MIKISGRSLCQCCFEEISSEPCPKCGFSEVSYTPDFSVLPCGSVLQGRYAVGRCIGKGGFGLTYLAYDIKLNRKIAIKEYFPRDHAWRSTDTATVNIRNNNDSETFKKGAERFYNEASLIAKFNGNSSIVNVYDFFYENATVYYSMEYLHGQTVKEFISKNGAMNADQVDRIAKEVASALIITHKENILHRDISPDNIMICSDRKIKLIDFGAARQVISEMSQNFSVILKPGFAPLEQYRKNGRQGPWTDIYSLGTTLYYCLTGKIPDDPMSRAEDDEEFMSALMPVDEGLRSIILKATALKIEDRYSSASDLLTDLKNGFAAFPLNTEVQQPSPAETPAEVNVYREAVTEYQKPLTMPEENVYGETVKKNQKPLVLPEENVYGDTPAPKSKKPLIAAIIGTAAVIFIAVLAVSSLNGKDDDTIAADAQTQSTTQNVQSYESDEIQVSDVQTFSESQQVITTETETETKTETETETETETKTETVQPSDNVMIGSEYYNINMVGILDLTGKGLKNEDIENLKYMTKVSEIILSDNDLTDLSPVSELKGLQKLTFHNNSVKDLSFVKNLGSLTVLGAGGNHITDISPLSYRSGLKELWIFDNGIEDLTPLSNCIYLKYVDVSDNSISDLTPLTGCKLVDLKASSNKLNGSYDAIIGLTIFGELHLEGNGYDADPDGFYEFTAELFSDTNGFTYWI